MLKELSRLPLLKSDSVVCYACGKEHKVFYGEHKDLGDGSAEPKDFGFIHCPESGNVYLASIKGHALM